MYVRRAELQAILNSVLDSSPKDGINLDGANITEVF